MTSKAGECNKYFPWFSFGIPENKNGIYPPPSLRSMPATLQHCWLTACFGCWDGGGFSQSWQMANTALYDEWLVMLLCVRAFSIVLMSFGNANFRTASVSILQQKMPHSTSTNIDSIHFDNLGNAQTTPRGPCPSRRPERTVSLPKTTPRFFIILYLPSSVSWLSSVFLQSAT